MIQILFKAQYRWRWLFILLSGLSAWSSNLLDRKQEGKPAGKSSSVRGKIEDNASLYSKLMAKESKLFQGSDFDQFKGF